MASIQYDSISTGIQNEQEQNKWGGIEIREHLFHFIMYVNVSWMEKVWGAPDDYELGEFQFNWLYITQWTRNSAINCMHCAHIRWWYQVVSTIQRIELKIGEQQTTFFVIVLDFIFVGQVLFSSLMLYVRSVYVFDTVWVQWTAYIRVWYKHLLHSIYALWSWMGALKHGRSHNIVIESSGPFP